MGKRIVCWVVALVILSISAGCSQTSQTKGLCWEAGTVKKDVIVYGGADRFAAWPANNGVWMWDGREILVGFSSGYYKVQDGHDIDRDRPRESVLGRSLDGGLSWMVEDPDNFVNDEGTIADLPGGINFAHPDFAMRIDKSDERAQFFISYSRGKTWRGPYGFGNLMEHPELKELEFTSRTDYLVNGRKDCFIFMSARPSGFGTDRAFCVRTTDGGKTFQFQGWIVPPSDPYRGVMPSTVRCSPTKLVSALRRRDMTDKSRGAWVDVYVSHDNGANWRFLSKVGDTGNWNGNPPALVRLDDGRLCCVYGNRSDRRMYARYSSDDGASWGEQIILRDDFRAETEPDLGYPRLVKRADGNLVAMYYWATEKHPTQHIAATVWNPDKLK